MITIDYLKHHPQALEQLTQIWHQLLGKIWVPDVPMERVKQRFVEHMQDDQLPLTLVAFNENVPIGMCSLRENDGILPELTPWLGSLVVDPNHQNTGVGRLLVDATKKQAKELNYEILYLFAFDPTIPDYYQRLGWKKRGMDRFKGHVVTVMEIGL